MAALSGRTRGGAKTTSESPRALIVMNETLGNLVGLTLQHGQYEIRRTTDPQECRALLTDWVPHLAFIDLDLYEAFIDIVGRGLTHGHTPIVAFTRRRDTALKLSAYERGADDILEVPFTLDEIVARPFALMRRAHGIGVTIVPKIKLDGLEVDLIEQRVSVAGRVLHLTPIQQTLLYLLAANAGKALSREDLLSTIWGGDSDIESNTLDAFVRLLRGKLEVSREAKLIQTMRGVGYSLRAGD